MFQWPLMHTMIGKTTLSDIHKIPQIIFLTKDKVIDGVDGVLLSNILILFIVSKKRTLPLLCTLSILAK